MCVYITCVDIHIVYVCIYIYIYIYEAWTIILVFPEASRVVWLGYVQALGSGGQRPLALSLWVVVSRILDLVFMFGILLCGCP